MTNSKGYYYITTPIYYVNDLPHIGHAYTTIAADVIARFMRLHGKKVMFVTGVDEHGQKVEKSAITRGIDPKEWVDKNAKSFIKLNSAFNITNNDFIRTTEERHKKAVCHLWNKLVETGNIYLDKYAGWYSMRDEAFYAESELTEDGLAPTGAPVEWVEEPSYFFALSKWQDKLLEYYENNPEFIKPTSRRNEVISFVKNGLIDLSVSRTSFNWGIKVPNAEGHVIYVWLDALTNYISALGYPEESSDYKNFWPADAHIVGKDILRFHAIYWPAFLMAAGLKPPKTIMAHGWWTNEGQKISKSVGNVIDPFELVDEFGLDKVRYFLMREVAFGSDGNYSKDALISRVNTDLSNKIGNLLQRTITLVHKYNEGRVPTVSQETVDKIYELSLLQLSSSAVADNYAAMKELNINKVLDNIMSLAEGANSYIDQEAPWKMYKTEPNQALEVLYVLLEVLRYISIMLQPFMPSSAKSMLDLLAIEEDKRDFNFLTKEHAMEAGKLMPQPEIIFPRI